MYRRFGHFHIVLNIWTEFILDMNDFGSWGHVICVAEIYENSAAKSIHDMCLGEPVMFTEAKSYQRRLAARGTEETVNRCATLGWLE